MREVDQSIQRVIPSGIWHGFADAIWHDPVGCCSGEVAVDGPFPSAPHPPVVDADDEFAS